MKSLICFAGAAAIAATLATSGPAQAGPILVPVPGDPDMVQTTVKLLDPHRVYVEGPTRWKSTELICPPALRSALNRSAPRGTQTAFARFTGTSPVSRN